MTTNRVCPVVHSRRHAGSNIPRSFLRISMRSGDLFEAFDGEIAVGVGHVVLYARPGEPGRRVPSRSAYYESGRDLAAGVGHHVDGVDAAEQLPGAGVFLDAERDESPRVDPTPNAALD